MCDNSILPESEGTETYVFVVRMVVKEWNKTVHIEQSKTALTEKPKFTVDDVSTKMAAIDRELKYLINKMKLFKPKPKAKLAKNTTATEESSSSETKAKSGMSSFTCTVNIWNWQLFNYVSCFYGCTCCVVVGFHYCTGLF